MIPLLAEISGRNMQTYFYIKYFYSEIELHAFIMPSLFHYYMNMLIMKMTSHNEYLQSKI
jgi:hypothetical protein